jgi:putative hydrolase of HD superfamily
MAIMIYLLKEYANEDFDVAKAMMMALIHDIVEIDAGDTYAYDAEGLKTQREREEKAADRIFGMLPEEQKTQMKELFYEFEAGVSPEAKFARAMDNFQPILLNDSNQGADWKAHGIKKSQVINRQKSTQHGSEEIWAYTKALIERNVQKGNLIDE